MKKIAICFLLVLAVFATADPAQSRTRKGSKTTSPKAAYYISIARSGAGQFSKRQWQKTADAIRRGGIPAFFADHESLPSASQIRGEWLLIKITRRLSAPTVDALMLGPFSSRSAASAAVGKLPGLLPDEGDLLNENYPGEWSIGSYIIMGVRTK